MCYFYVLLVGDMEIYCGGNGQEQVKTTIIDEPFGLTTTIYGTAFGLCDFGQQNQTQDKTNKQRKRILQFPMSTRAILMNL